MKEEVRLWIIKALEDLRIMAHEMRLPSEEVVTSGVCFHAQQFVEKLLKAYLVSRGIAFGRAHNLEYLLARCQQVDKDFAQIEVGNLTDYAVQV